MAKPPSYFLFHPDRVGIIIFACDFFKLKPPQLRKGGFLMDSNTLLGQRALLL